MVTVPDRDALLGFAATLYDTVPLPLPLLPPLLLFLLLPPQAAAARASTAIPAAT